MSNIIEFILSDYDEIINARKREKYFKCILNKIINERKIIVLFISYIVLLIVYMFVMNSEIRWKIPMLSGIAVVMCIILVGYYINAEKFSIKNSKNYYDKYKEEQKKLVAILKNKYRIATEDQLEKIICYCNNSIESSEVSSKVSEDFKKIFNTILFPSVTFLGGVFVSEYKPTTEEIATILLVVIFLAMLWMGIKHIAKPLIINIFDFRSMRYRNLKARLDDLYVTHYMEKEH